jgi:hypothetical protein
MWQILETIENSGFSTWVRETPTVLGYSTVLALHTFGMAFLVGLSALIAARVLGIAPKLPLAPLEGFFPLIILGFWVNALTGLVLTGLAVRSFLTNADFYIKLVAIAGALVCLQLLRHFAFRESTGMSPRAGKIWAGGMLCFWMIAILAGRLLAYSDHVRKQSAVAVLVAILLLALIRAGAMGIARRVGLVIPAKPPRALRPLVTTSSK